MTEEKIQKIRLNIGNEEIKKNLETYKKMTIDLGASDAKIIKTSQVSADERVTLKCEIPKCYHYGNCAHCPPHTMTAERTRKVLSLYENAIVFKTEVPPDVIVITENDRDLSIKWVMAYRKITEICNKVESAAFYKGDYLALGFAAGSCHSNYCNPAEKCAVLGGKPCIHYYRTRPSMESVGIDCFKLATELGWEIIPIGSGAKANHISHGTLMGLVLIN